MAEQENMSGNQRDKDKEMKPTFQEIQLTEEQLYLARTLTLHYISRVEQGETPTLEEYTVSHPEIKEALQSNIYHYWLEARPILEELQQDELQTINAGVQEDSQEAARTSETIRKILAKLLNSAAQTQGQVASTSQPLESLYKRAREKKITPVQLANKVNLSSDILKAFEDRLVNLVGMPRQVLAGLSEALDVSQRQLINYLAGSTRTAGAMYFAEDKPSEVIRQSFSEYITQSLVMKEGDKARWLQSAQEDAITERDLA